MLQRTGKASRVFTPNVTLTVPFQMHIVHIKEPYTSVDQIKDMADGLAVVGVFLQAGANSDENAAYQKLLDVAQLCAVKGECLNNVLILAGYWTLLRLSDIFQFFLV